MEQFEVDQPECKSAHETLGVDALRAFFSAVQGRRAVAFLWAYSPGAPYGESGYVLDTVEVKPSDALGEFSARVTASARECGQGEELGLCSKVLVLDSDYPGFQYVHMFDLAPGLAARDVERRCGDSVLSTGNSYHLYRLGLQEDDGLAEMLAHKYPLDTSWAGISLRRGFGVLRISGVHKPTPTLLGP